MGCIDVRDVAKIQLKLLEDNNAKGRYISSSVNIINLI
jgi:hypothetical protein